ncbi:MAG: endolytic transglycosylase MltG [Chloroflexi bacterium]|nr:endolytic transglycosylase MltG [Chloroflexota bacterium]
MIGALARFAAIVIALAICAGAAIAVYGVLGGVSIVGRTTGASFDAPVDPSGATQVFTVKKGDTANSIGDALQRAGLIRSTLAFRMAIESRNLGNRIEAGDYELSPALSTGEIIDVLARGAQARGRTVTVPEGWRIAQIGARLEAQGIVKAEEFRKVALSPREFGIKLPDPAASSLEGFLFPDTYQVREGVTARDIAALRVQQFERHVDAARRQHAASQGLSLLQAVTLASIVERETGVGDERSIVAGVYRNRLTRGMLLGADPTVQYALASQDVVAAATYDYWKRELSADDLTVDSPYNTYRVAGLPPAPICNPGQASIDAALSPADTPYLYFVARGDGSHAFAQTAEQHLANVQKYR